MVPDAISRSHIHAGGDLGDRGRQAASRDLFAYEVQDLSLARSKWFHSALKNSDFVNSIIPRQDG
jgi:hypothetical protein